MATPSPSYAPNSDGSTPPGVPVEYPPVQSSNGHTRPTKRKGFSLDIDDDEYSDNDEDQPGPSAKRAREDEEPELSYQHPDQYSDPAAQQHYYPPPPVDMSNQPAHRPRPGLIMKSLFGVQPADEVAKIIGEWLLDVCKGVSHLEIEVKLGTIIDKHSNQRMTFPGILNESVLQHVDCAFRSEMSLTQHRTLNQILNQEVSYCSGRDPSHPVHPIIAPHEYFPINYKHTYLTDSSYPGAQTAEGSKGRTGKRRVTRDTKTGEVLSWMEKRSVATLNVLCPKDEFDWRISVNQELPCEMPPAHLPVEMERVKDRLTYTHQFFQIDLTQVKSIDKKTKASNVTHELELEILDAGHLLTQGWFATQGQANTWEPELECLVNTVRMLNKNAGPRTRPK